MKRFPILTFALAIFASGFVSCSSLNSTVQKVATPLQSSLAKLHGPIDTPPIVKVDKTKLTKSQAPKKTERITASRSASTSTPTNNWKAAKLKRDAKLKLDAKEKKAAKLKKDSDKKEADRIAKAAKKAKADAIAWKRKKEAADKKALPKEKALVRKKIDPSDPPIDEQIPAFGILPSLTPGESTSISNIDNAELELPDDIAALPPVPSLPVEKVVPDVSTILDKLKRSTPTPPVKSEE